MSARQAGRVDHGSDVVLDEAAGVARLTGPLSELDLQRRQRANETHILDQDPPECRGKMNPGDPPFPQDEQPAEDDEDDEAEMQGEYEIGQSVEERLHRGTSIARAAGGASAARLLSAHSAPARHGVREQSLLDRGGDRRMTSSYSRRHGLYGAHSLRFHLNSTQTPVAAPKDGHREKSVS